MLSEDCRLFLTSFLSFLGDTPLPYCFPISFNLCDHFKYCAFRNFSCQVTYINLFYLLVVLPTTDPLGLRTWFKAPVLCNFLILLNRNNQSVKNATGDNVVSIYAQCGPHIKMMITGLGFLCDNCDIIQLFPLF